MHKTTLAVIDRSEIFKFGLFEQLSKLADFRIMECDPEGDVFRFIEDNSVEIVLIDLECEDGIVLGKKIVQYCPTTKVIIMSSRYSDDELFECLKSGAAAYLDKNVNVRKMINTIKSAAQGRYPINNCVLDSPIVANKVIARFQELAALGLMDAKTAAPLTKRETQILTFIANGDNNKKTANRLGLSEQTIKNHVSAILRKLNANDRAHAVAIAVQNQWVAV